MNIIFGIITILGYATLYIIGGRPNGRLYKRVLAPLWLTLGLLITSGFNWWTLLASPIWFLETQLPRGKDSLCNKILCRVGWALFYSIGAITLGIISHNIICIFAIPLTLAASLYFGIGNPLSDSWGEWKAILTEGAIIFLSSCLLVFII